MKLGKYQRKKSNNSSRCVVELKKKNETRARQFGSPARPQISKACWSAKHVLVFLGVHSCE